MQIVADLHLHSRYSRAVSPQMNLLENARWASKKGIDLISTADWTHPLWFRELTTNLKETAPGIYQLKDQSDPFIREVSYLLSTEISTIYSQDGKTRRIHNLLCAPSLDAVDRLNKKLTASGAKLLSDGRPIIGMSSKDLLETALSVDPNFLLIPAHAWTPWYGIFGSMSGFNSLSQAFGPLAKYIYGIETGLSSDPAMNWQIKELDNRSILSFSDAHSGPKIGREATVFVPKTNPNDQIPISKISYSDIANAIKQTADAKLKIGYTIEFFPEEGKYHWSGHRDCGIRYSPKEIKQKGTICPVCKRTLTEGVESRVANIAGHDFSYDDFLYKKNNSGAMYVSDPEKKRPPFVSLIPLLEILLEAHQNSPTKAKAAYENLTQSIGAEFDILLKTPYDVLQSKAGELVATAIKIVRERQAIVDPGFDGVFGKVAIFKHEEKQKETPVIESSQTTLF